jgi:hypothetical protein
MFFNLVNRIVRFYACTWAIGIVTSKSKLLILFSASWVEEKIRRKFFLSFAKEKGFDPLIPDNWYLDSIPYSTVSTSCNHPF